MNNTAVSISGLLRVAWGSVGWGGELELLGLREEVADNFSVLLGAGHPGWGMMEQDPGIPIPKGVGAGLEED